jgi:protein-S-isoprenylcysteine O-methyltransferase Ste14
MTPRTSNPLAYFIAAIAGVLGVVSLSAFGAFLWTGALGLVDMSLNQHSVFMWDAALCLIFFLQHSGMIRRAVRARLSRVVPRNSYGIVYTIKSGAALLLLVSCWQPSIASLYALQGVALWSLRGVLLLSLGGVLWGIRSLREFDAFGIQDYLSRVRGEQPHPATLTIRGPYRFVRHPFYFFGIVALWSAPTLSLDRLLLNLLFTVWIVFGAVMEERDLMAEFGEKYRLYQQTVPMLVPLRSRRRMSTATAPERQ